MHILATFATLCYQTQWPPNHSCTTRGQNVPFWAIFGHPPLFGHFGPFWAILGIFGPFWPFLAPPAPPAPIFGPEFPRPSPKTSPRTSAMRKKLPRTSREEKIPAAHSAHNVEKHFPAAHSAQILPAQMCTQIRRPNSAHKFGAQNPRKFSRAHFRAKLPDANSAQSSPEKNWNTLFSRKIIDV